MNGSEKTCLRCGAALGPARRQGYCAACLFAELVAVPVADGEEEVIAGSETGAVPKDRARRSADSGQGGEHLAEDDPGRRLGAYELLEEVGRGGMGIVYKARQRGIGRLVAVKLLRFGALAGEEFVKRLRVEATAAGCLRHPNIVAIHEVGIHEDQHYLAMDYVAGPNLSKLAGNQPMAAKRAATLVRAIAGGIHHAHERGILHRDLKPSNILIDADDQPRITDFGLAKRLDAVLAGPGMESIAGLTLTGQVLGSPNYMPPEQASANKGKTGRPSDVYSIGAILYQLLTGRPPFMAESLTALLHQVLEAEPVAPRLLNPAVPEDLETICLKCLEKEPERRYTTAGELEAELGRFLNGDPIQARALNTAQRWWRWCRRHYAIAGSAGAALLLLLVVAIGSPVAAYRINRARQAAEAAGQRAAKGEAEALGRLYAVNMNQAQAAYDANQFRQVYELLEEAGKFSGRGFEWFFWQRQMHLGAVRLLGHWGRVFAVAFSPDGQRLVSVGEDGGARIWDTVSGTELAAFSGHEARVRGAAWFPDGRRVATASDDHTVRIWEAGNGAEVFVLRPNRGRISGVAVSPDGQWVAGATADGTATIWLAKDGSEVRVLTGHRLAIKALAFSPDSKLLVTGGLDGDANIWEAGTGRRLLTVKTANGDILSTGFSPDGRQFFTAGNGHSLVLRDTDSGRVLQTLKGHSEEIEGAAFFRDGQRLATGSQDWSVRVWDATSGGQQLIFNPHSNPVYCVDSSPDGTRLAAGSGDSLVMLWDVGRGPRHVRLEGQAGPIRTIAFSPDGRSVLTSGDDGSVWLSDAVTGRQLRSLKVSTSAVWAATFLPDGRRIATASRDNAKVWDTDGRELLTLHRAPVSTSTVAASPDGRRVASGAWNGTLGVFDAVTGREEFTLAGHPTALTTLVFSPDSKRILSGSWDKTAKIRDAATGQELQVFPGHTAFIDAVAFSPDGRRALTGSRDRTARLWEAATGREILAFRGHAGAVTSVAFSHDGRRVLTGSEDRSARLWDAVNGSLLLVLPPGPATVYSVCFSPDDRRIATSHGDGSAAIWEAATPAETDAWRAQAAKAAQKVAAARQEHGEEQRRERAARARESGALRAWLLLASIPYPWEQTAVSALDTQQLTGEGGLRPVAGERVQVDGKDLVWSAVQLNDTIIDFAEFVRRSDERVAGYAVCYMHAETAHKDLRLLVGSDDLSKIYVNGREVYRSRYQRGFREDEDVVEGIELKAGTNVLVFKVININSDWMGSIRVTDHEGKPPRGFKAGITP